MAELSEQELRERASLVAELGLALNSKDADLDAVLRRIKLVIAKKAWTHFLTKVDEEVKYPDTPKGFIDFIKGTRPNGLGTDPETVKRNIKGDNEATRMYRKAITPPKHKHHDNHIVIIRQGNSQSYGLGVLHDKHPALYEKVMQGEYSVNRAMIEAGERKLYNTRFFRHQQMGR